MDPERAREPNLGPLALPRRILVRGPEGGLVVENRLPNFGPSRRYGPRAVKYRRPRQYPARLVIRVGRTERTYLDNGTGHRLVAERPL